MNFSHITSDTLRKLIPLTEKRDELIKNLRAIESDIAASLSSTAAAVVEVVAPAKTESKAKTPKRASKDRSGRGRLKEQILALLEAAGNAGLGVKEIADKLGVKAGNVYVWFSSTGKALTTKIAPGRYAVKKSSAPATGKKVEPVKATPVAKAIKSAAKSKPAVKQAKGKRNISPEARAKMAAAAKARWEKQRASKPAAAKKAGKPAKKAPKVLKKGFKLPAPE